MAFTLYTIGEAVEQFNDRTGCSYREETLRNQMKAARLTIHRLGKLDLIAEEDLSRLVNMPRPKRGRPKRW